MHFENAVLEFGFHLGAICPFRKRKTPHKGTIGSLDPMIFFVLVFFFEFPFAADGEGSIFYGNLDVFFFYLRQFHIEQRR